MSSEYEKLTSNIDAREILRYLNELGIRNISGEVLKYFITDLKKFIKHDIEQRNKTEEDLYVPGPERLHSATTFCSRSRSKVVGNEALECIRKCCKHKEVRPRVQSAPVSGQKSDTVETNRRACSCTRSEKKSSTSTSTKPSSANLIKVQKQQVLKKSDPVSLYHYYTQMWAKYKSHLPGENNWSNLRWQMRQKMAGYDYMTGKENKVCEMNVNINNGCININSAKGPKHK